MTGPRHVAVLDIGKTNAKVALVDLDALREVAVVTRPNIPLNGPPWRHFDTAGHWTFLLQALGDFHRSHGVEAISVTTHGASAVLLDAKGDLAAPILDYEHPIPDRLARAYDALRPDFAHTGSPRLAHGLNLGAQLHYQFTTDPGLRDRTRTILGYPQYWGFRLTGERAFDVTSIGCHTDLWQPERGAFSDLVGQLGIDGKIAPIRTSAETLGTLRPEIARATGLPPDTPVAVGIHDSNASLYPHLLAQQAPFSVVSTGTWVIAMAMGGHPVTLDPARDTLINVNAMGAPVPSARFMGGREYDLVQAGQAGAVRPDDTDAVLQGGVMLLPAVAPGSGPFPGRAMRWEGAEPATGSGARSVALSWYLAMMTDTCLSLIGAAGPTLVEGPFARNAAFIAMLRAATGREVRVNAASTGTSIGAALLFDRGAVPARPEPPGVAPADPALAFWAAQWRRIVAETG